MTKSTILFFLILTAGYAPALAQSIKKDIKTHREKYLSDLLSEEHSPFYKKENELKNIQFYKAKKKYRVECSFERTLNEESFDMATYSGMTKKFVRYGILTFRLDGREFRLEVYQNLMLLRMEGFKDYLFIPFKDLTNGGTTYGGGRYFDIKVSDIKGDKLMLDFNKCYNPYCAFSDGYNCPIPPKVNHLDVAIKAGEKNFVKED
jgi:uncharacterized protein